jgi:O-antigen ligase
MEIDNLNAFYPNINKIFVYLFCGYVVIWYLQIGARISFLGDIRFEFIYAFLLTIIAITVVNKDNIYCPLLSLVVLYFFVLLLQLFISQDFDTSWNIFIDRIVKFAFMAFFITFYVRTPDNLKLFIFFFLLACFKMGQEGFTGTITGSMLWENQGVQRLHGVTGLYRHPNSFSGMAVGTLPFIYALWPISSKYSKFGLIILLIFSLNIIIFTGSRTGYVAFIAFILFVMLLSKHKLRFVTIMLLAGIIATSLLPNDYIKRFESIYSSKKRESESVDKRKQILEDSIKVFWENPMGVGISAFPKVRYEKFGRKQDTHNLYLEVATNLGIHGFIIFFGLIIYMIIVLKRTKYDIDHQIHELIHVQPDKHYNMKKHIQDLKFMSAIVLAVILFISVRLVLGMFGMDLYEIYWWFALGLTTAIYNINNRSREITRLFIHA